MSGLYFPPNTRLMVQPSKDFPLIYRRQLALLVVLQNMSDGTTHVQGGIVRCKDKKKFLIHKIFSKKFLLMNINAKLIYWLSDI